MTVPNATRSNEKAQCFLLPRALFLMKVAVLVAVCSNAVPAYAEDTPAWAKGRPIADWVSTGLDMTNVGVETWRNWQAPDRKKAFLNQGLRIGIAVGIAELTKHFVHRTRPDGSDNKSFFSEHTAIAAASKGFSLQVSIPLTMGVGYLRMAAAKHHPSDVGVGAAVGEVLNHFIP